MKDSGISEVQAQILESIRKSIAERGYPPTIREIGAQVGISSPSVVHGHLHKLENLGLLEHEEGHRRAIRLPASPTSQVSGSNIRMVPVLRADTLDPEAFSPAEAVEHISIALRCEEALFALRMPDESMLDAGILPGDFVIVRRKAQPSDGSLVAVRLEGVLTLRRWKLRRGTAWLFTDNPEFPSVRADDTPVFGTAALIQRRLVSGTESPS